MNIILGLISILCTVMFFLSGIDKLRNISLNVNKLSQVFKTKPSSTLITYIIISALFEILAPILIVYCAFTGNYLYLGIMAALGLFLFTVLVTYIFKFPPTGSNYYPFISNITTSACMLLIAYVFSQLK